jgi:hypothetical protein
MSLGDVIGVYNGQNYGLNIVDIVYVSCSFNYRRWSQEFKLAVLVIKVTHFVVC